MTVTQVNLRLDDELLAKVETARGDVPRNKWIQRAIEERLNPPEIDRSIEALGFHGGLAPDDGLPEAPIEFRVQPDTLSAPRLYASKEPRVQDSARAKANVKPIGKAKR